MNRNFIFWLVIFLWGCSENKVTQHNIDFRLADEISATPDSFAVDFNFYPERWNICGDTLWVVNSRDSAFLTGLDLDTHKHVITWGNIGNGPEDFVSPGIIEEFDAKLLTLYGNTENKVVSYRIDNSKPIERTRGWMPMWMSDRGIPKPYTRIAAVNDSVVVGTYFFPRHAGADIFNTATSEMIAELTPAIDQPEENMSGPYEFKVAVGGNKVVLAYRYIQRIEVYDLDDSFAPTLNLTIGNTIDQYDLYDADRDQEMIKYFSDIQCDDARAYILYHGVAEERLGDSAAHLLVYDLDSGSNIANINLGTYFNQLLIGRDGTIYLYSPQSEDYIFTLPSPLKN